jgi:hypothetical protein
MTLNDNPRLNWSRVKAVVKHGRALAQEAARLSTQSRERAQAERALREMGLWIGLITSLKREEARRELWRAEWHLKQVLIARGAVTRALKH